MFAHPFPSIEGRPPEVSSGDQIVSTASIDEGFNLEDFSSISSSGFENLADSFNINLFSLDTELGFLNDESIEDSGDELFANTGERKALGQLSRRTYYEKPNPPISSLTMAQSIGENIYSPARKKEPSMFFRETLKQGLISTFPTVVSVFSKRYMMKLRAV